MKTNKLSVLLFYCSIVLLLVGCGKREIKNIDSKGKNIICFGDSITFGYGVTPQEAYPAELAKLVIMPVINAGIDGDTSVEGLKRLESDILERDPYLVIIEFGGNDFLRKIPQETTINNIIEMIDKVQAKGAIAAVADISAGLFLKEYRHIFEKICRQKQAVFVPSILSGIITNPSMKSDFLHPNANGYKMIAQRVYQFIKPYLKDNSALSR